MAIYDRDYYRESGRGYLDSIFPAGTVCKWLIGIQCAVYLIQLLSRDWPVTQSLALIPRQLADFEAWRLLTYAFVSDTVSVWAFAWNIYLLWHFGSDLEQMYGAREFLVFYLLSALLGGLLVVGATAALGQWNDPTVKAIGAAGALTAVVMLFAWHFPDHPVRIFWLMPVPVWVLVIVQIAINVGLANFNGGSIQPIAVLTLTGAAFGALYYQRQWQLSAFLRHFSRQPRPARSRSRPHVRAEQPSLDSEGDLDIPYDSPEAEIDGSPVVAPIMRPAVGIDEHLEAKVDAVLEKMARTGKDSLTDSERQILLQASEIYRKKRTSPKSTV